MPMKNMFKAKLLTALVLGLGISLVAESAALAADLTYSADVSVTIGANTYTIVTGSEATSVVVDTTTVTVVVPLASNFVFKSPNSYLLNNNQSISTVCSSSDNTITVPGPVTVIITPDATSTCSYSSGGGGGGGGGGSTPVDVTPPTNTTVVVNGGAAATTSTSVTLTLGAVGASQMIVGNTSDFVGSSYVTYATSLAWTLTSGNGAKTVYAKFKDAAGNVSGVVSDTITLDTSATPEQTIPPATVPPVAPPSGTPADERAAQVEQINDEAGDVSTSSADELASAMGVSRNLGLEQSYDSTLVARVVVSGTPAATRAQVLNFVTYGTPTSKILGAGERAGVVNSFREAFGRVPQSQSDWQDVLKIANGRWPGTLVPARETSVAAAFKKVYLRNSNRSNAHDDAAITIMAYGLRPLPRNLNSEKAGILTFKAIFGKSPSTATDWDTVRAIAYSGSTR